jgi:4a-hydroxytetrahydrobiopterin dehydratase
LAELAGKGETTEELIACKIGGCRKTTPLLSEEDVQKRMAVLPAWTLTGSVIERQFTARHWQAAMDFLNAASTIAEAENHHPDLHLTGWRNVTVQLSTHAAGGLTLGDFVLAAKLDTVEVDYSPKWLKEQAATKDGRGAQ